MRSLGAGDFAGAEAAALRAESLDQIGAFAGLAAAISQRSWESIAAAVGPGPLGIEVETLRDDRT